MAGVKLVVMYPRPKDIEAFEKLYQEEHVPMAVDKLVGKTKFIATKVVATPDGTPLPSTESPRSISRPWRHCKRVRSPMVAKKRSPMPSKSQVVARRFSWLPKSKHIEGASLSPAAPGNERLLAAKIETGCKGRHASTPTGSDIGDGVRVAGSGGDTASRCESLLGNAP
jgi:hypothetical protein